MAAISLMTRWRRARRAAPVAPDFLILGAMRAGTTSLYSYLVRHPRIRSASVKEVHYFDIHAARGDDWYRSQFPQHASRWTDRLAGRGDFLTGEATPYYLFHPHVPRRVARFAPAARFIVMLRDPVARTHSQYLHEVRCRWETLSFEEALAAEEERLRDDFTRLLADERNYSFNHQHYSYLARSLYAPQVERWFRHFDREQFLFLKSEDMFCDPQQTLTAITDFLDVEPFDFGASFPALNVNPPAEIDPETRQSLQDLFRPHNERLYELLGRDFGWEADWANPATACPTIPGRARES